ncbi:MAG: hypothetical protein JSR28_08545 [Proteobacteria bacterium]|nr:hypothetical protein [Pseudomonadota bacterium]
MTMRILFAALAFAAIPIPVSAQPVPPLPTLDLEQETTVRCAAAFAIVSSEQGKGSGIAAQWPALGTRGREFFVRTGAQLMDETGATRPQVQALFARAAGELRADPQALSAKLEGLRAPCLSLLDLAVPPG